jgi:hypothetical protein
MSFTWASHHTALQARTAPVILSTVAVRYLSTVRSAAVAVVSAILLGATPTAAPVHVMLNEVVGMWDTVAGNCNHGQHLFTADGKYKVWCFDSFSEGEWSLRDGNKIIVTLDPKTNAAEIITVLRVDRYSDHVILNIRYQNGTREKWMK